ncbi:hypothetical protein EDB89DRAFT_1958840 [Lactarius sanguifluus]|nr:hypothetical protein EDB89DRAFT_1958840 [Lactarius sanguifluus]
MGDQLLGLPGEILVLILSFLPLRDITTCKRSCWQLRAVIKQSGLLRCRIRTMKNYIEDRSPPGLSTCDFLESLKKWEKAWLTFGVGKEVAAQTTYIPYRGRSDFLLRSGYLIEMRHGEAPGLSYLDLSSQRIVNGVESPLGWTDIQLAANASIGGWALDVDQNLVAVSLLSRPSRKKRLEIRLLHFPTGTHHHSASLPGIQLDFEGKYDTTFGTHMEIMGDNIAVLLTHGSLLRRYQTLYLVNWVQGRVQCRRRTRVGTYFPALTSISEDILVLARKRDWALELCKITRDGDRSTFALWTLCMLQLPAVHPKTRTDLTNCNRMPSGAPHSSATPRSSTLPFRSSPTDSVLAFSVCVSRRDKSFAEFRRLFFYVLPSTLRSLVAVFVGRASSEKGDGELKPRNTASGWLRRRAARTRLPTPVIVPWVDWGPRTTRWVSPSAAFGRQTLSGMRCAFVERGWTLRVLDFNPGRLRRVVAVRENGKDGEKMLIRLAVTTPNTTPAGHCFLHDFTSSLPYYELKRNGVKGNFIMDDEWIAQIESDSVFEPGGYSISVHSVLGNSPGS